MWGSAPRSGSATCAALAGTRVSYLKPHGARYHSAGADDEHAAAVVEALRTYDPGLALLCQGGSRLAERAVAEGVRVVAEALADRGYAADGGLVPRGEPGAVVVDPTQAGARTVRMVREGVVETVDGTEVLLVVDSVCVHSDSPGAVEIATAVQHAVEAAGVPLRPVAAPGPGPRGTDRSRSS